jgi:hypothetical protein
MAIGEQVQRIGSPVRRWAKAQEHAYNNGEDRPLGGFLGAMSVYSTVVAIGAAVVRASGKQLPERIPLGDAVLITIGTFRLARRIAKDPVTSPLRAPFASFNGASGEAELSEGIRAHGGWKHAVGELVTCPFCLAQWVGTAFVFGYVAAPNATRLAALVMTTAAGSDVLQFAYDALQSKATGGGEEDGGSGS